MSKSVCVPLSNVCLGFSSFSDNRIYQKAKSNDSVDELEWGLKKTHDFKLQSLELFPLTNIAAVLNY